MLKQRVYVKEVYIWKLYFLPFIHARRDFTNGGDSRIAFLHSSNNTFNSIYIIIEGVEREHRGQTYISLLTPAINPL